MRKDTGNYSLKFKTTTAVKKSRSFKIFLVFSAIVLVLAAASAILIINNRSDDADSDDSTALSSSMKEEVNIMYALVDNDDNLVSVSRFKMNTSSNSLRVKTYSPAAMVDGKSLNAIYGGDDADTVTETRLADAFGEVCGDTIDRYIIINESDIGKVFLQLGYYDITLEENIKYEDDSISLYLLKGTQSLNGDEFFEYVSYLAKDGTQSSCDEISALIADLLIQQITVSNANNGQKLFEYLSNYVDTDISIDDFSKYTEYILQIAENGNIKG